MRANEPLPGEELNAGEVTEAREAASVILLRDSERGPEVLLVQRNPEQRFMGGAWVFPGGSTARRRRGRAGHAPAASLRRRPASPCPADAELVRYSRWITPAQVKVRFDTHFFVARAPDGAEARVDGAECVGARWIRPQDALDAGERDELMLVFPTIKHLEQLARARVGGRGARGGAHPQGDARRAAGAGGRRRGAGAAAGRARLRRGMSMSVEVGLLLALVCAFTAIVGFLFKHRGAVESPPVEWRRPVSSSLALFRSRWYVLGIVVAMGSWAFHVGALALAPISLVQSVIAGGLVLLRSWRTGCSASPSHAGSGSAWR